jgi:hypothetical protein
MAVNRTADDKEGYGIWWKIVFDNCFSPCPFSGEVVKAWQYPEVGELRCD